MFSKLKKAIWPGARKSVPEPSPFNCEKLVTLDAEDLAEQGIADAYRRLLPELRSFVAQPLEVEDLIDENACSYSVHCNGVDHLVYSPSVSGTEQASWGRAAAVFFQLVNEQLAASPLRFYAINGGNDLGGVFLTEAEAESARAAFPRKEDWPYFPTMQEPWHGQFR